MRCRTKHTDPLRSCSGTEGLSFLWSWTVDSIGIGASSELDKRQRFGDAGYAGKSKCPGKGNAGVCGAGVGPSERELIKRQLVSSSANPSSSRL